MDQAYGFRNVCLTNIIFILRLKYSTFMKQNGGYAYIDK